MNNVVNVLAVNVNTIITAVVIAVIIAVVLGLLLAVASKFLQVKQDERVGGVVNLLPGYNCGACGKAGCQAFAEAIVAGEVPSISGCKVIKPDKKAELKNYLDNTPGPDGSTIKINL